MIADDLTRLRDPRPLGVREVRATFDRLTSPTSDDVGRAAVLIALGSRGDRPSELVAFAREMRRRAVPFPVPTRDRAVDLCGSGGAPRPSFNISTVSAFVARAAGLRIVKHGNRSRRVCGSSDLLVTLGLPVVTSLAFPRATYHRYGIAFLHAPLFHPATRAVASVRRRLGIPTIFNRLGPLSNPARVHYQVTGAADLASAASTVVALRALGVRHGAAMTSDDGCDEFSPRAPTTVLAWGPHGTRRLRVHPAAYLSSDDRRGPWGPLEPSAAAEETERILAGGGGARRGSVLLTAAAALWVTKKSPTLRAGVERAREALDTGAAEALLERLRSLASHYPRSQEG